jgi:hypothetical protein
MRNQKYGLKLGKKAKRTMDKKSNVNISRLVAEQLL